MSKTPYETLRAKGNEFVEVHNHENIKLYVCNINDKSLRVGIVSPKGGEMSFVIKQPKVLRRFFEQALQLLPEDD